MIDPPRSEAYPSVQQAQRAGIRVVMITGDHPATATAIATELGIVKEGHPVLTGQDLRSHDDITLQSRVQDVAIYARVEPEQKLRIVKALQENAEIVAMTGDGVNDAPALKKADIGIAMGRTGTDVSRQAADMVLVDGNFASIVAAVEEGRGIFLNIQKCLSYLFSSNIGEMLTMFLGVVLATYFGLISTSAALLVPLTAIQILWINLMTDAWPALALGVDPRTPDLMKEPLRSRHDRVISKPMIMQMLVLGIHMALGTLIIMDRALPGGFFPGADSEDKARIMAFTTLVLFQLFNTLNARSTGTSAFQGWWRNHWLWGALMVSLVLQGVVLYLPRLQQAFRTTPLTLSDWFVCLIMASSVLLSGELLKWFTRLKARKHLPD